VGKSIIGFFFIITISIFMIASPSFGEPKVKTIKAKDGRKVLSVVTYSDKVANKEKFAAQKTKELQKKLGFKKKFLEIEELYRSGRKSELNRKYPRKVKSKPPIAVKILGENKWKELKGQKWEKRRARLSKLVQDPKYKKKAEKMEKEGKKTGVDPNTNIHNHGEKSVLGSKIIAEFSSDINYYFSWGRFKGEVSGRHYVAWYGYSPYNADWIKVTIKWKFMGLLLSVSWPDVSGYDVIPLDFGIFNSVDGKVAQYKDECKTCWRMTIPYDDLRVSGYPAWREETCFATFQLSGKPYRVDTRWGEAL
jgi:hypothetical protein